MRQLQPVTRVSANKPLPYVKYIVFLTGRKGADVYDVIGVHQKVVLVDI